jgi:hypothetical protein
MCDTGPTITEMYVHYMNAREKISSADDIFEIIFHTSFGLLEWEISQPKSL